MLKAMWHRWLVVAKAIGAFQSRVILSVFYFLVLPPFALGVWRLDPLGLRTPPHWHVVSGPSNSADNALRSVQRQF